MNQEWFEKRIKNYANLTQIEINSDLNINISQNNFNNYFKYLSLVWEWNKKINLISVKDKNELLEEHLLDSLTLAIAIREYIRSDSEEILDIGSGNGFPGIILAIFLKNPIYLCEPREKRVVFLKEVRRALKLQNLVIKNCRMEELKETEFKNLKIITARALGDHDSFRNESRRLLEKGKGMIVEMRSQDEKIPPGFELELAHEYYLSSDNKKRLLMFLRPVEFVK